MQNDVELQEPNKEPETKKSKAKKKKWPWVVGIIVIVLAIPVLFLGYLGFVPGLSGLLGANKAVDLGVKYTAADFESYKTKTGVIFVDFNSAPPSLVNPSKKTIFANPKSVNTSVSQSEITAAINNLNWVLKPINNAQVKLSDNNKIEISGNINLNVLSRFTNFIGGVGYSQSDVNKAVEYGKKFVGNAPIYIDATGTVTNNQLKLTVNSVKIGRYTAPNGIAQKVLSTGTQNAINRTAGLDAKTVTVSGGNINFDGTLPTTVYVKPN